MGVTKLKKKVQKKRGEEPLFVTGSGDDGSPVYDEKGNFVGMQIASSGSHQIVSKAEHIQKALEKKDKD